jgi:hypothetical protein
VGATTNPGTRGLKVGHALTLARRRSHDAKSLSDPVLGVVGFLSLESGLESVLRVSRAKCAERPRRTAAQGGGRLRQVPLIQSYQPTYQRSRLLR